MLTHPCSTNASVRIYRRTGRLSDQWKPGRPMILGILGQPVSSCGVLCIAGPNRTHERTDVAPYRSIGLILLTSPTATLANEAPKLASIEPAATHGDLRCYSKWLPIAVKSKTMPIAVMQTTAAVIGNRISMVAPRAFRRPCLISKPPDNQSRNLPLSARA